MDRYKFRGKCLATGEWFFGSLVQYGDGNCVIHQNGERFPLKSVRQVDPSTVGQFTGLKDANGNDVYEGDKGKITFHDYFSDENFTIEEGESYVERIRQADFVWCIGDIAICNVIDNHDIEVIGTIHDQGES